MNYKLSFIFLFLIIFSFQGFSNPLGFNYLEVRSNSYPVYQPYQYANYYDSVDLRYSVYSTYNMPYQVVVSPKVYGITYTGQRIFVHNLQTTSFLLQPYASYSYVYNPMFSFDPSYQFYDVVLDLQTSDGTYQTSNNTYVYYKDNQGQGTTPPTSPQTDPTCDDFSISGFSDIYLEEDTRDYYDLYIINSIDKPLTITSVTTNPINIPELDVENISFPYTVSPYQTRSAQLTLFTDTVSSNYNNFFDIKVKANYENLFCEKTYNVRYYIDDQDLENTASCNDLKIFDDFFTISSNENKDIEITFENTSFDYYFDVDSIELKKPTGSIITANIKNNISRIDKDSSKLLKINLKADKTDDYKTEEYTLKIDGYYKRDNREDRRCKINQNISFRVNPTGIASNDCKDITIYTRNLLLFENTEKDFSKEDGFYIYNNSNKKFTITGINYTKSSNNLNIFSKPIDYNLYPKSSNSLNFSLKSLSLNNNMDVKTNILVQGYFQDGESCSFQDIKSTFNVSLVKDSICSNIEIIDSDFKDGENLFTIKNKSDIDFYVNDIIYQNRQNTNVNVIDKSFNVLKNSNKSFKVGTLNKGSFELLVKGKFSNGTECDFTQTNSGYFSSQSYSFQEDSECSFDFDYQNIKEINNATEKINISFKNLTDKRGSIKIEGVGVVVTAPIIYFDGSESFNREISLTNIKNPKNVIYTIDIAGCLKQSFFTTLKTNDLFFEEISLTSYLSKITSKEEVVASSFSLKNNSSFSKEVVVKFSQVPEEYLKITLSDDVLNNNSNILSKELLTTIASNQTKNIYFKFDLLKPVSEEFIIYFEVYSEGKLIIKEPITVDFRNLKEEVIFSSNIRKEKNLYFLDFTFENKTDTKRNLSIIFKDLNYFNISGSFDFSIDSLSKTSQNYIISGNQKDVLEYAILDSDTGKVIGVGEYNLKAIKEKPTILSGFFSVGSFKWGILLLLFILIVYILYIGYKNKKSLKTKQEENKVREDIIREDLIKEKIIINEKEMIINNSNKEVIENNFKEKEITFKELDKFDKKETFQEK